MTYWFASVRVKDEDSNSLPIRMTLVSNTAFLEPQKLKNKIQERSSKEGLGKVLEYDLYQLFEISKEQYLVWKRYWY